MITKGSRVRHRDSEIDKIKGVMTVLEIKSGIAFCVYGDYARINQPPQNYNIAELKAAE